MLKRLFIVLLATFFFVMGCGQLDNRIIIKVALWGSPEEIKIISDTVRMYEKTHPNIKVELQHSRGGADYIQKVLTQIAGGDPLDIAFAEVNVFVPMFEKDVFLDLTPFIQKDKEFDIKEFFPEVVRRFTRDGKIYCIPRDTAPFACVFYNKKLFDEAGVSYPKDSWNYNDLIRIAKQLTKRDDSGNIMQYGFHAWAWMNFVFGFGGQIVDKEENPTKCVLNKSDAIKGLQFYADLCYKYKVSPSPLALNSMQQGPADLFLAGKLAMFSSGIWETPRFRSIIAFDWDVAMFPKGPKRRAFGSGGSGYCITKATKHPKEAWEVLKVLAGDYGQEMLAKGGLAQPANRRIAEGEYWAKSKEKPLNKKMLNEAVKYAVYEPFHPKWQEAQDKYLREALDDLFNNEITAQKFASEVVPKIDKLMFDGK